MSDPIPPKITPDDVARMVMLVYGTMSDSQPFWCFVAVRPSRQQELEAKAANKTLDLRTYEQDGFGEIVVSGEGLLPPNDVIKSISAMFNTPIRQLFSKVDANSLIAQEIERVKKELGAA